MLEAAAAVAWAVTTVRLERAQISCSVELRFAGGGTVRLDVECLEARMQDLGAAWAAKAKPEHAA